jgi:hypothetical protein
MSCYLTLAVRRCVAMTGISEMIGFHHRSIMMDSEVVDRFVCHPFLIVTHSGVFERSKRPVKFSGEFF